MQDRWLHQQKLRLSQDLPEARRERVLPAPIRMHHACNQVRRKLQEAHQEGEEGLKGRRIESHCACAFTLLQKHTARTLIGKRFFLINFFFLFKKERGGYIYTHAHALINACIHEGTGRPFKRFQSALYHHLARAPCLATSTKQCLGKGFAPPIFAPSLLLSPLPQLSQARHQLGKV